MGDQAGDGSPAGVVATEDLTEEHPKSDERGEDAIQPIADRGQRTGDNTLGEDICERQATVLEELPSQKSHLRAERNVGVTTQPRLFLWGIEMTDDLQPWDLLIAARERFEKSLPVKRPATEPDIALHIPGKFVLLCEAKFTSPNPVYMRGPRKDAQSLTLDELVSIYRDPALVMLDDAKVEAANPVAYQLFRNLRFAEYMAKLDSPTT
ncbi:MAG: hypothetical protein U0840_00010, partial [Gemmataceae bacterium]